jgi:DNA-binding response OmpR family regulator
MGPDDAFALLRQGRFDLVLVNRVLDADGSSGLELIRQLLASKDMPAPPVMLVSNYEDAQRDAVAAGAAPGFGKAQLDDPNVLERLREPLAP